MCQTEHRNSIQDCRQAVDNAKKPFDTILVCTCMISISGTFSWSGILQSKIQNLKWHEQRLVAFAAKPRSLNSPLQPG
jgi:hypothetical protein